MPEMPEAALVAAQAYLLTTQPELGDPRERIHQAAIKGLGLIGDKLSRNLWKRRQHSMSRRRKETDGLNLRKPEDPVHPVREIADHKGTALGTSSHRPG
jgi:hypothetical protein